MDQIVGEIRGRLERAPLHEGPFLHVIVEDLVPEREFAELAAAIPPLEMFHAARNRRKLDLDIGDVRPEFSRLPEAAQATWRRARDVIFRQAIAPTLVGRMSGAIRAKYEFLFGPAVAAEILAEGFTTTDGRLMCRKPGYDLQPHTDSAQLAVTCLLYFSSAPNAKSGALCLFRAERQPQLKHVSTYYPYDEEGIPSELAKTIPLHANLFVAFINGPVSLHGLRVDRKLPDQAFTRLVYQAHIVPRGFDARRIVPRLDAPAQARWRKEISGM